MIDELREAVGQPEMFKHVQEVVADWPGAKERMAGMREYFSGMAAAASG